MLEKLLLSISTANGSDSMLNVKQMKKILSSVIARGDVLFGALFWLAVEHFILTTRVIES